MPIKLKNLVNNLLLLTKIGYLQLLCFSFNSKI